mmetsp:Transcript_46199/g.76991  ORF Transcript_46199/g.76991 Transcript_46199/m.76991 type:complete len:305 (-) Transcript_46199:167-1081(-)
MPDVCERAGWCLKDKLCIVTGANTGIGLEVAAGLAAKGADVIMACRNAAKCEEARQQIMSRGVSGTCVCESLDISDPASIHRFSHNIRKDYPEGRVAVIVHNAGVMGLPSTGPNILDDPHFLVNHLGTAHTSRQLLTAPSVLAPESRVVVVGSQAHRRGTLSMGSHRNIAGESSNWYASYARSKLANSLFANQLQRRLRKEGSSTDVFTVSPGRVNTTIFDNLQPFPLRWAVKAVSSLFHQTPEQGASTILYAACEPTLSGRGGAYLHDCKEETPSDMALDTSLAKALWEATESMLENRTPVKQ